MTSFDPRTVHSMPAQQYGTPRPDAAQFQSGQFASGQFRTQGFAGQQYTGPVPPPPSQQTRKPRPMAAKIIAGFVAAGLVVGGAGTWMALSGSSAEAAVQTTSFAGANPTTSPFGTDAPQVAAVAATGPQPGDTTGLYAATTPAACTTADYLTQLQSDPAKLAAVGGVFGIGATDVPAFVNSLSPVVLRAATSVTDHPYTDGAFTEQPAVLAAGTAVLVNSYGEPTVKCFNGNPLTGGASTDSAVTVVPTTQVISQFSFTSVDNSSVVIIPGKPDPKPVPGPNPTTTPQPDPELVKKAQEAKATAETAHSEATAARQKADDADTAARIAASGLTSADTDLATAIQAEQDGFSKADQLSKAAVAARAEADNDILNQAAQNRATAAEIAAKDAEKSFVAATIARQRATTAREQAKQDLETKQNQAKNADAAATNAEGTATQADKNAKDAQDKADASAKTPTNSKVAKDTKDTDKTDATKTKVDPTGAGQQGKTPVEGQTPVVEGQTGTGTQTCTKVVNDAAAVPNCPLTGSADTATGTKPATGTTTGTTTGGGSTSNGSSKGTSSDSSSKDTGSSTSSSSTSGSQSSSKEGSDK